MYIYIYVCICIYVCVCMCVCIYIYIHTHIYVHFFQFFIAPNYHLSLWIKSLIQINNMNDSCLLSAQLIRIPSNEMSVEEYRAQHLHKIL